MELHAVEIRILGCLVEKAATTPDNYPLSTNALVNACNQTSNRDPVMSVDERTVDQAMLSLRTAGLARTVTGGRANKHRHVIDEAWSLGPGELAVLAVLFLRGAQTVGELRGRTERLHDFAELDEVEATLESLASRHDPFVRQLDRQPGQKERRWVHLLGEDDAGSVGADAVEAAPAPAVAREDAPMSPPATRGPEPSQPSTAELEAEITRLRRDVDRLYELLGEEPDSG